MKITNEIKRLIRTENKWQKLKKGNLPVPVRKLTDKFFQDKNCLVISDGNYAVLPLKKDSVVYSGGLSTNISFELELIEKFSSKIYAFDPTEKSKNFMENIDNKNLKYYDLGVSKNSGNFELEDGKTYKCTSLVDFAYGNDHKRIDLLKLDIEGYEYGVIEGLLESGLEINQIVLELHGWMIEIPRKYDRKLIRKLKNKGYKLIWKNLDNYTFVKRS